MKRKNLGFSWLAFVGLALSVCGCPIALMASENNILAFGIGLAGVLVLVVALLKNRLRVFG
jgi:hypothetical protein